MQGEDETENRWVAGRKPEPRRSAHGLHYLNDRRPRRGENDFKCAQRQPRRHQSNACKRLKENYFQSAILHKSSYQSRGKVEQTFLDLQDSKKFSNSHTSFSQATNKGCAPSGKRTRTRKGNTGHRWPHRREATVTPQDGGGATREDRCVHVGGFESLPEDCAWLWSRSLVLSVDRQSPSLFHRWNHEKILRDAENAVKQTKWWDNASSNVVSRYMEIWRLTPQFG